jgi:hypothetical protein
MGCRRSVIMLDLINTIPVESITEEQAKELIVLMSEQKEKVEVLRLSRTEYNNIREMIAINSKILSKIDWIRENKLIYGKTITLEELEEQLWQQWKNIDSKIEKALNVK